MGQPVCLEENFVTNLKSSTEMAPGGSRLHRSPHQNPYPIDPIENKLARDPSWVGSHYLGNISLALSYNPILGSNLVPAIIPALVSTKKLFKKFIKTYLEINQGPKQLPAERKQTFKTKVSEVYYGKWHIDCYHFCQQCKDHFKTVGATGANRTPFAALFLCENISMYWAQFKHCNKGEELTSIT